MYFRKPISYFRKLPTHVDLICRIMVRKLKYHEQKLLKKVDFVSWKVDKNVREVQVLKRYRITKREDYSKLLMSFFHEISFKVYYNCRYNRIVGQIKAIVAKLKELNSTDQFRITTTTQMLEKL